MAKFKNLTNLSEAGLLLIIGTLALIVSGLMPKDRFTWWLETAPIFLIIPTLVVIYDRFKFTPLVYRLIFFHALILMIGGHYTYAETPIGFWFRDLFDLQRNHFDRFGHFLQGAVPAIVAREILLRRTPIRAGKMLFFIIVCFAMFVSSTYELIEWLSAEAFGQGAEAFLGTQGDQWDAQKDMSMALIGAITSQLVFTKIHDRELKKIARYN